MSSSPPLLASAPLGTERPSEPALANGSLVGRYIVLDPLGYGAMGVVYRAFDPELDRRIAVKLLRPTAANEEQERLLREGKALARLSHPNVVTVYDVGTYGARVFVAMELVAGETVRAWLREKRSWQEIVALFVQAGKGLAAAHAAGIIHRDFKPDNALVGVDGRVRVLDFGLAWTPGASRDGGRPQQSEDVPPSFSDPASERRWSMVGTPRYSPPEQIEGEPIDARADQFAFCASLWEALCGETPFAGEDVLSLLCNVREAKVRGVPRKGVPRRILDALRGGLAADPEERFPSMQPLLDVLEVDRTRSRVRWVAVVGSVAIATVATAAATRVREQRSVCDGAERNLGGVWDAERKSSFRQALVATGKPWAVETVDGLSAELDRYARDWVAMHRDACEATSVRHEQSATLLDLRMQCLNQRLAEMRAMTTHLSQPDDAILESAPKVVYSLVPLSGCADPRALEAPVPLPRAPAARKEVDRLRIALADVKAMNEFGQYATAAPMALDLTTRAAAVEYAPLEADALETLGNAREYLADFPRAVEAYRRALWAAERGLDRLRAASALVNLVWAVGVDQGLHDLAHDYAAHASAILAGLGGDLVLEAELASHESTVFRDEGRLEEAETRCREAVEKRKLALGAKHPRYAMALANLAAIEADQGRIASAFEHSSEALAINAHTLGEHHPDYAMSLLSVAASLNLLGRATEAYAFAERGLVVFRESLAPDHTRVARTEWAVGMIETSLGRYADAERDLRHAMTVAEERAGAEHPYVAQYACALADTLAKERRYDESVVLYRRALAVLAKASDPEVKAEVQTGLGLALVALAHPTEGLSVLEDALQWREKNGKNLREVALTRFAVARALWAAGRDHERARRLAAEAIETDGADPGAQGELREMTEWLDGLPHESSTP